MTSRSMTTQTTPSKLSPTAWKPKDYQKKVVKRMLEQSCLGLFLDPGLGKTSISLATHKILLKEKLVTCGLVIAPLRPCYLVWPRELQKWADFNGLTMTILHGKDKEKNLESDADLYVINPDGLKWLFAQPSFKKKFRGQALYVDESSQFKNSSTQRFKMLRQVLPIFNRRYILTGTPAPNGLLDLFGQIYILDQGAALGRFITHYRAAYFYKTGFQGYEWKLQQGADTKIHEKLKPLTVRLDAADHLELPQLIVNNIDLELDDKSFALYKEMEDELIVALERGDITAVSAAVASGKCSQLANGGIYDADGKPHLIHTIKAEAVKDLVDEFNGAPALIAYEYEHDLERLRAVFGKGVPYIGGGMSPKRVEEIERQWNRGELPVLLGQPASMAHGLNLQGACNHIIWHSLNWNFEYYDQFNKRVLRQGNTHSKVFVHHLIMRDTVDELKIMSLNNKFRTQKNLFDALNTFLKKKRDNQKYPFASKEERGILTKVDGQPLITQEKGETTMGKFSTKKKEDTAEAPAKKEKMWTNNPDWQNQETGETTEAGEAQRAKTSEKTNVKPFAKVSAGAAKATKAPAKKAAAPKKAAKASADGTAGRSSPYAGKKIKILNKDYTPREGSFQAAGVAMVYNAKNVDDVLGKTFKVAGKDGVVGSIHVMRAIEQGLISVG